MQKAQGATEFLVLTGVVLMIALVCIAILVWPTGTSKDAKKQQTDIHFKIGEIGIQAEGYPELLQGLVAYYKFDEGSGTTTVNNRGGASGTLVNGATWTTGKSGTALDFDGTDWATIPDATAFNFAGNAGSTISLWFKTTSSENDFILYHETGGVPGGGWYCEVRAQGFGFEHRTTNGRISLSSPTTLNNGLWHHAAIVIAPANNSKLYIDGASAASDTTYDGIIDYHDILYLGTLSGSSDMYTGSIDELMFFNRALSANEIRFLYENPGYPN